VHGDGSTVLGFVQAFAAKLAMLFLLTEAVGKVSGKTGIINVFGLQPQHFVTSVAQAAACRLVDFNDIARIVRDERRVIHAFEKNAGPSLQTAFRRSRWSW